LVILYVLTIRHDSSTTKPIKKEGFRGRKLAYLNPRKTTKTERIINDIVDDIVSWDDSIGDDGIVKKEKINSNFLYIKWHNDYRDVVTAINNLIPERKQFFNLPNIPVNYSEPETAEVKNLVKDFIEVINKNLVEEVPSYRNPNSGWDEAVTDPNLESGWEKVQKSLGLAPSLYDKPAGKAPVRLVAIQLVQKYETEDEIKYSIDIVLGKESVEDQIVIKASFVQDKRPTRDENNFFYTRTIDLKVVIEDLYILGFLSNDGVDDKLNFDQGADKYYDYNMMEQNNLTDPKQIQRILMDKYRQRSQEMEQRNALLDEEGQEFHAQLPNIYDFSNIKGTRTIFDDMNSPKHFE
jgi:hypothetical protein